MTSMELKLLNVLAVGKKVVKSKLTKNQKELFLVFQQEQQRLNQIVQRQFLRKYLLEQRTAVNKMASYIKKRDRNELKTYGRLPIMISIKTNEKYYSGAPISKFKITNNVKDLHLKIRKLDAAIDHLRGVLGYYEMEDHKRWEEQHGGGHEERMRKIGRRYQKKIERIYLKKIA
jgi:hypothetical protein